MSPEIGQLVRRDLGGEVHDVRVVGHDRVGNPVVERVRSLEHDGARQFGARASDATQLMEALETVESASA